MSLLSIDYLTEEQKRGIEAFATWYKNGKQNGFKNGHTFKLAGPAGTGKTTVGIFAIEAAGLNINSPKICKVAYTGKAALVMSNKGMLGARTIHSSIYTPLDEAGEQIHELRKRLTKLRGGILNLSGEELEKAKREIDIIKADIKMLECSEGYDMQWMLDHFCELADAELIVCDEASMVGGRVQVDLESFNVPILYLGDSFQLMPIFDPRDVQVSVFFDRSGRALKPDFELTQIHRQAEGSPIIRYSRALRENRRNEINFFGKQIGDTGSLIRVPEDRILMEHLGKAEQIIVGYNDTRHAINANVREFLGYDSPYPVKGDKLIMLKNNKDHNVFNGLCGVATDNYYDYDSKSESFMVDVELETGFKRTLPLLTTYFQHPGDAEALNTIPGWIKKKMIHADYGYAISCNKSQGSSYRSGLIVNEPFGRTPEDRRRWEYTAITRFSESAVIAIRN